MKAPDKIYVCVTTPPIALACSEVPWVNKENNFEFIRKDALLEWAESKHKDTDNMDVRTSMRMLIDKLNEM